MSSRKRQISFILSAQKTITATWDGNTYVIPKGKIGYETCLEGLKKDDPELFHKGLNEHYEIVQRVSEITKRSLRIQGNTIVDVAAGVPIHTHLVHTILKMRNEGQDFKPLFNFLEKVEKNPSYNARQDTYTFLERKSLPLCDDGCFLGYKRVTHDYKDCYTQSVDNRVGTVVSMDRNKVDDDSRKECSTGFHIGTWEYATTFRSQDGPLVICKVDPADVVAVDRDGSHVKLRTCRYEVMAVCTDKLDLSVFTTSRTKKVVPKPAAKQSKIKRTIKQIKSKLKRKKK